MLLLTETQLYPSEPNDKLQQTFMPFTIHWQPHTLNFNGLAVLFSSNIDCLSKQYIPSINVLLISISKQLFQPMTILLVYRNHHDHQSQFLFHLRQILLTNTVHTVFGDFNLGFFTNDSNNLKQLTQGLYVSGCFTTDMHNWCQSFRSCLCCTTIFACSKCSHCNKKCLLVRP